MAQIPFAERQPYVDKYDSVAYQLCYGGFPDLYGSLLIKQDPLREDRDHDTGVRYVLERERDADNDYAYPDNMSRWSRDYRIPPCVTVLGRGAVNQITISDFSSELTTSRSETLAGYDPHALSLAIGAHFEQFQLEAQRGGLRRQAARYAGKAPGDVTDPAFTELAVEVPLRQANFDRLRDDLWRQISKVHGIARTAYDPLREAAHLTLSGRTNLWGEPYMSSDAAISTLLGSPAISSANEENR